MPELEKASKWPFVGIGLLASMAFVYGASARALTWWLIVALYLLWVPLVLSAIRHWGSTRTVVGLAGCSVLLWFGALLITAAL